MALVYLLMRGLRRFLVRLAGEAVGDVLGEGVIAAVLGGPLWLLNYLFGPFNPDRFVLVFGLTLGALGLAIFVAIGVSRHPEAWKVQLFGAFIAIILSASLLYSLFARKHVGA